MRTQIVNSKSIYLYANTDNQVMLPQGSRIVGIAQQGGKFSNDYKVYYLEPEAPSYGQQTHVLICIQEGFWLTSAVPMEALRLIGQFADNIGDPMFVFELEQLNT